MDQLPKNAQNYVRKIEEIVDVPGKIAFIVHDREDRWNRGGTGKKTYKKKGGFELFIRKVGGMGEFLFLLKGIANFLRIVRGCWDFNGGGAF